MLKPSVFFAANAAGDVPPDRNGRSVLAGASNARNESCCRAGKT
jgi:primary-amine oxidase